MFLRKLALTLVLTFITAFATAAVTWQPGGQAGTAIDGKRQDRLVPAGGFAPRQLQKHSGYGVDELPRG